MRISISVCAAPVPRLTLPSLTIGTVWIWHADLLIIVRLWPCSFGFLCKMSVFVLSCNIIMSLSILMYFFTVFETAPLYSFIYIRFIVNMFPLAGVPVGPESFCLLCKYVSLKFSQGQNTFLYWGGGGV